MGHKEQSPLISGTFPLQRARDVVAWARGAKSGVDFLRHAVLSHVRVFKRSCSHNKIVEAKHNRETWMQV